MDGEKQDVISSVWCLQYRRARFGHSSPSFLLSALCPATFLDLWIDFSSLPRLSICKLELMCMKLSEILCREVPQKWKVLAISILVNILLDSEWSHIILCLGHHCLLLWKCVLSDITNSVSEDIWGGRKSFVWIDTCVGGKKTLPEGREFTFLSFILWNLLEWVNVSSPCSPHKSWYLLHDALFRNDCTCWVNFLQSYVSASGRIINTGAEDKCKVCAWPYGWTWAA